MNEEAAVGLPRQPLAAPGEGVFGRGEGGIRHKIGAREAARRRLKARPGQARWAGCPGRDSPDPVGVKRALRSQTEDLNPDRLATAFD
jgi:hypothetical protein